MTNQEFFDKSLEEITKRIREEEELNRKRQEEEKAKVLSETKGIEERIEKLGQKHKNLVNDTLQAIVNLEEYQEIMRNFNSISGVVHKMEYIGRVVYERTDKGEVFNGPVKTIQFYYGLKEIGMPMLCPFLNLDNANKYTHEDCTIDGEEEPVMSSCQGMYDVCVVFKDRANKSALGLFKLRLPKQRRDIIKDSSQKCLVDLQDLGDWWRMEGKYS